MPTVRIPTQGGGFADLSFTDNGDGTYSPDVIVVAESGTPSTIKIPLAGGGVAEIATFVTDGVHTLAAMAVA